MRNLYLTIFCLNLYSIGLSQGKNFKITYRHNLQFDTLKILQDTIGMEATLIGNSLESNYSFAKLPAQNNTTSKIKKEDTQDANDVMQNEGTFTIKIKAKGIPYDSIGNMVYLNKKIQTLSVREHMTSEYIVTEEKIPVINWKLTNDVRLIKGYNCKKATTHFRGRDYIAWFTTDISIEAAPWKFVGLPGLVIDIEDTRQQVKIYFEKIEYPVSDKVPPFVKEGTEIAIEKYFTFRNEGLAETMRYMESLRGPMNSTATMYSIEMRRD